MKIQFPHSFKQILMNFQCSLRDLGNWRRVYPSRIEESIVWEGNRRNNKKILCNDRWTGIDTIHTISLECDLFKQPMPWYSTQVDLKLIDDDSSTCESPDLQTSALVVVGESPETSYHSKRNIQQGPPISLIQEHSQCITQSFFPIMKEI